MDGKSDGLRDEAERKCVEAESCRLECLKLVEANLSGAAKLLRKITTELNFLQQISKSPKIQPCHISCTNLSHYRSILQGVQRYSDVVAVVKTFRFDQNCSSLVVDIVAGGGHQWIKVVARSAKGIHRIWSGDTGSKEKSILRQGRDFMAAAQDNVVFYRKPSVKFDFMAGVSEPVAKGLQKLGIEVVGDILPLEAVVDPVKINDSGEMDDMADGSDEDFTESEGSDQSDSAEESRTDTSDQPNADGLMDPSEMPLNLDITALFALVSNLTNGHAEFDFDEVLLNEQASWERKRPVLSVLKAMLKGRKLVCCRTAYESFMEILKTVGGPSEKIRSAELLKEVEILDDCCSQRVAQLQVGGKIKLRSKIIFGTADQLECITVTANRGFVQAAENQGVKLAVLFHESRALSEQKEARAKPLASQTDSSGIQSFS